MKRIGVVSIAVMALAGALTSTASAQARGYIGAGGGVTVPVGSYHDTGRTGWLGQVIAGITGPTGKFGGRIDGFYGENKYKVFSGKARWVGANADLLISPVNRPASLLPYVIGGIGFVNLKTKDTPPLNAIDETKFSFNAGAGLQLRAGDRASVYVEGKFYSVRFSGGSTNFIPITLGLRFGGL